MPVDMKKRRERQRLWSKTARETDPEKYRESNRRWRKANPERARECSRRSKNLHRDTDRAWKKANAEKVVETNLRYREKHRDRINRRHLRSYGLTEEDFAQMLLACGGRCPICDEPMIQYREPAIDHDHDTDAVRGLLCGKCNKGIGLFRDDPDRLRRAIKYLEKTHAPN